MLIRRNTKAFKAIQSILTACEKRSDRKDLVRVFITKAGESVNERIDTTSIKGQADLFYDMTFQAVLGNLESANHQLRESEENPGLFFFRRGTSTNWDETPFEFDTRVKSEFSDVSDLPAVRRKGRSSEFVISGSASKEKNVSRVEKKTKVITKEEPQPTKNEVSKSKPAEKQPTYRLKHKITFTNLRNLVWSGSDVTKQEVLDYYNKVADVLVPHLRERELSTRFADRPSEVTPLNADVFAKRYVELPDWIRRHRQSKGLPDLLLCDDREHLLFYVENGCLEFYASPARIKSAGPDYIVIQIDSPDFELAKATNIAKETNAVLSALGMHPVVKADGKSGIHTYIPLDAKGDFKDAEAVAEYVCKLLRLKLHDYVSLAGSTEYAYGKVTLDFRLESETHFVAPYSLVMGDSIRFSAPLAPADLSSDLTQDDFTLDAIGKQKSSTDPFNKLKGKKTNATAMRTTLKKYYSFII